MVYVRITPVANVDMQSLLFAGGLLVLVGLLWAWRRGSHRKASERNKSRDSLDTLASWQPQGTRIMTTSERKAYAALRTGLPEHLILAQVPLARFLKVPTRHSYSEWLRRVGVLCADLVVCDSSSQVIAVVDIRAPEAQENERTKQRHTRMDRVLEAAEIPLHVWREDNLPTATAARNAILNLPVDTPMEPATEPAHAPSRPAAIPSTAPADPNRGAVVVEAERDPPPSTWFDDLDSAAVPLAPVPMSPRRSSGPSIR